MVLSRKEPAVRSTTTWREASISRPPEASLLFPLLAPDLLDSAQHHQGTMAPPTPGEGSSKSSSPSITGPWRSIEPLTTGAPEARRRKKSDAPIPRPLYLSPASPLPISEGERTPSTPAKVERPPWDRVVDVVCHKDDHSRYSKPTALDTFSRNLKAYRSNTSKDETRRSSDEPRPRRLSYDSLPDNVRLRICQYLTTSRARHPVVTLSRPVLLRDAWPPETFTPITAALAPYKPYLSVSTGLRADMMISFLASHTFHVVFSPYVNTRLSPYATLWLFRYGMYMRSIVLEIDMSKLGGGLVGGLLSVTAQFEKLVVMFAESQTRRAGPLDELILLCRRYHGVRPDQQSKGMSARSIDSSVTCSSPLSVVSFVSDQNTSDSSYCPDDRLRICDPLLTLRDQLSSLRMCGFSDEYTREFLTTMFPETLHRFAYRLAPSAGPWGRLPDQRRFVDDGKGIIVPDDENISPVYSGFQRPVMPPPPVVDPYLKTLSRPFLPQEVDDWAPSKMALVAVDNGASQVARGSEAVAPDMSASEKKRRFLKLLGECLLNREKRRLFSR
jgi:hypothetical protein